MEKQRQEQDDSIFMEAIVGFVVTKSKGVKKYYISIKKLIVNCEGEDDLILELNPDEEIIAVIPAFPGSFKVSGLMPDDSYEKLGYEYPGASHPDWPQEQKEMFENERRKNESI